MTPKVFLTGATGFIGGDLLYLLTQSHPDWEVTCIVRNKEKGAKVIAEFPNTKLVYGDNKSAEILEAEASKADIVIHTSASDDDEPSARAISRGLARGGGHWIHTSGGLILARDTFASNAFGEKFDKIYDDWENIDEILRLPDDAPHRKVDKIVLDAGSEHVKVAIVCPAVVYGEGRGPDKKRSFALWGPMIQHGRIFAINKGENVWHMVHVRDLSKLYILLAEAAANGGEPATWNEKGYYLAENGPFVFGQVLTKAAEIGFQDGYLPTSELQHLTPAEANAVAPHLCRVIGANSRGVGKRGKALLGWRPDMPSFEDEIANGMAREAQEPKQ